MRKWNVYFLLFITIIFSSSTIFAASAKITAVHISNSTDLTRFTFEIKKSFRYQWQFSENRKRLSISIDNAVLATTLPKPTLSSTSVQNYNIKPISKSALQLQFQLKTPVNPKIYTLAASTTQSARLVVDFKSTTQVETSDTDMPKSSDKTEQQSSTVNTTNITKPKLTLSDSDNAPGRPIVVVIDPGHGGKDSGAVGPDRTREKDVVLAISKALQASFNQQPKFQAQLTRSRDIFIPLRERLAIARRCRADIFIAIHADAAYKNQDAIGASVFALSERGATSEMARWLAKKENESEFIYGVVVNKDQVLRSVLLDLSQTHTIAVSLEMGQEILNKLSNITRLHYKQVEQAAFVVLKSPDIPSLLIETGYITNPMQEQKLKNPAYQQELANTIVQGVMAYFAQHPPGKRFITT